MRSSPFCHFPGASNSFQTLASVLFCFHFHFATFPNTFSFPISSGPDPNKVPLPRTYILGSSSKRERGGGEKGHEVGSYCLYKISFEHSKIWKTIRHHHQDVLSAWVLLPFPGKERFDAAIQQPNGQFFSYSKTNNQDGVNYSRGKIQDYPL